MPQNEKHIPIDGLNAFKKHFLSDSISGFIVFLLALPLSLSIAQASDFPPIMGLISAIIGGIFVSFFSGSKLTIKGPAAGLIVIVSGAVAEFGQGDSNLGWHLALGAMLIAGLVQVVFGFSKFGKFVDFFPISAIRGMLAAIGLIIISKQIPVLLNINPDLTKGKNPFELLQEIPHFLTILDTKATFIGCISLTIMLSWHLIKNKYLNLFPASLIVLLFAIPATTLLDFKNVEPEYSFLQIGKLIDNIAINISFSGITQIGIFIKYVLMFALVGSLESLLTVKAIDLLDSYNRKSDMDKDLKAVGYGNMFSALLGGLPMISEVARSASNVSNGAKTRWANFFHGFFILIFLLLAAPILEMIPNAALAAMLIAVGIKLAHPKEFIKTYLLGKEQIAIFLTTIFFTLLEDLLIGISAGIILKIIIHLSKGIRLGELFNDNSAVSNNEKNYFVSVGKVAIFSNFIALKNKLQLIPGGCNISINFEKTKFVDLTVKESLIQFKKEYENNANGSIEIIWNDSLI